MGHHLTTAAAERNLPVRILGYQGVVHRAGDFEPSIVGGGCSAHPERTPGQSTLPGFCRLLPQLVGSFDPGGGVSGDGCRPDHSYLSAHGSHISAHSVASGMTLEGFLPSSAYPATSVRRTSAERPIGVVHLADGAPVSARVRDSEQHKRDTDREDDDGH